MKRYDIMAFPCLDLEGLKAHQTIDCLLFCKHAGISSFTSITSPPNRGSLCNQRN